MRPPLHALCLLSALCIASRPALAQQPPPDRSPVDLAVSADERWVLTANQTSDSVSLLSWPAGQVVDEQPVAARPAAVVRVEGARFLVSCSYGQRLVEWRVEGGKLAAGRQIALPGQPVGVVVDAAAERAYVALESHGQVAEVSLAGGEVTRTFAVGRWPQHLALSQDGRRLVVSTSGDRGLTVVDLKAGEQAFQQSFVGLNIGHLALGADGRVYFPWMVYRRNPITAGNIRLGWVLASRIGRLRPDVDERREAVSLDPPGEAIADPYGLRLTSDGARLVVSASGTHELLVYRTDALPFESHGSTDHLDASLRQAPEKFSRIELGGRPMGLRILSDDKTVLVADYLGNRVQAVDIGRRAPIGEISLGGPPSPSLARQGQAIFYDARRSLDQWYSCHSCHQDGGSNSVAIDTFNDGTARSFKTVLPLHDVTRTGPWTWHGWQTDLRAAMRKSITSTMLGKEPSERDVDALIAYLETLQAPPKAVGAEAPRRAAAAARGAALFRGAAGCAQCHRGEQLTDGEIHDVGLGARGDRYRGFNTPSLRGVSRKVKLLHDGRADSLEEVLRGPHSPAKVAGAELDQQQLHDLIEYLRQL